MDGLSAPAPVAVVGAGAVGICAAAYLQQAGCPTVVIDPAAPATRGASWGNAACINPSSIMPVAMPGVLRRVPGWLLHPDGPLVLRAGYLPRMLPWLTRFVRSSRPEAVTAQAAALCRLLKGNVEAYLALAREADALDLIRDQGNLVVYSTDAGYVADQQSMRMRREHGVEFEALDAAALRDLEPNLAQDFTRGYLIRGNGYLTDPSVFLNRIADRLAAQGVQFRRDEVLGVRSNGAGVSAVTTRNGDLPVRAIVIATGAWSKPLVHALGDRVLLDTERGYHIEMPAIGQGPMLPTMWGEGKLVTTPLRGRIRCAGTVELAGLAAAPDWRRADLLARLLGRMYPGLASRVQRSDAEGVSRWLGFRPSTPDSLPVIGRSRRHANAIYAFGHGHVGLTAAPSTGRLVAQLVTGQAPALDLSPFSIDRFN